jgi:hypothetical protein
MGMSWKPSARALARNFATWCFCELAEDTLRNLESQVSVSANPCAFAPIDPNPLSETLSFLTLEENDARKCAESKLVGSIALPTSKAISFYLGDTMMQTITDRSELSSPNSSTCTPTG